MNHLDKFKTGEEVRKMKAWKALTPYKQHITLMYIYRVVTDLENITMYLETMRFNKMNICTTELPDFIFYLKPKMLREHAYDVIQERIPA